MNNIIDFSFYKVRKDKEVFQQMLDNIMVEMETNFLRIKCDKRTIESIYAFVRNHNTIFYQMYGVEDVLLIDKKLLETKSEIALSMRKDLLDFLTKDIITPS